MSSLNRSLQSLLRTLKSQSAKRPDEIEDYLQDALVKNLEKGRDTKQWLAQVNLAVRMRLLFGNREPRMYWQLSDVSLLDKPMERVADVIDIKAGIATLTSLQQRVILAYFYEGKTMPEIATELGISKAAIHFTYHRALKRLRKHFRVHTKSVGDK